MRVHASGTPFTDPSGDRLRAWLAVAPEEFYDQRRVAMVPMGFCFPGHDAAGGDLPPRQVPWPGTARPGSSTPTRWVGLALGVGHGVMGWLIASRRPGNRIGWVFLLIALTQAVGVLADLAAQYGLVVAPGSIPLAAEWSWVAGSAWAPQDTCC